MWAGAYERELVDLFKRVIKPGMVVLDVGANIGYFSVLAAGLVGSSGEVHAFEPVPTCFYQLQRNLAVFPWADASSNAVSDQPGSTTFYFSENANESGWGSIIDSHDEKKKRETVPLITLDDWATEKNIRRIDFIKMDIEGAEYRALQGAMKLLARFRPTIVAELNEPCLARDNRQPADVLKLLWEAGYDTVLFNDGLLATPRARTGRPAAQPNRDEEARSETRSAVMSAR